MQIIERIQSLMREHASPDSVFPPPTMEEIQQAEETLGVRFPKSYVWFLLEYGATIWPDYVYGLSSQASFRLNVVKRTLGERTEVEPQMYPYLIAISPDGWGNHYCIDTSREVEGENPIIFWNHESDNLNLETTHANFLDFFEALCLQEIQWKQEERIQKGATFGRVE